MKFLNEFIFDSFDIAINIHKQIFKICREKGCVTYADLYLLIHPEETNCENIYSNHGWTNLWNCKIEPYDDSKHCKWILKMPKIELLKNRKGE